MTASRQVFEGLDREGRGFLTAEGIKEVVGLDFGAEEVGRHNLRVFLWRLMSYFETAAVVPRRNGHAVS